MITTFLGLSIKVWIFAGDPDNNVRTSGGSFADVGEWFMNTNNGALFVCTNGVSGSQTWQGTTNTSLVQAIIASTVLQSDWAQSNSSIQDFIKNKPSLSTVATSGSYNDLSNKPTIPAAQIQSDWTQSNNAILDYIKNKPALATVATTGSYNDLSNKPTIPAAQIQSDWTQTNTSSLDYIKNKPAAKSVSSATRSLNTIFQINSTRDSQVVYSVDIACTSTLVGGQTGTVYLETSPSSTFASGIVEKCRFTNANSVSLAIAITVNQTNTAVLSANLIPAGYYVRLRTDNVVGTPTFTYRSGEEVLL